MPTIKKSATASKARPPEYRPKHKYGKPGRKFMERLKAVPNDNTVTICAGSPIPPGFVIVGVTTNFSCSNQLNNALIIKRPGPQETVCGGSPIPPGYVIVGVTTNFGCSNQLNNALIIKIPGQQETVCAGSPIPPGYVIVGTTTNFGCSNQLNNALIIRMP